MATIKQQTRSLSAQWREKGNECYRQVTEGLTYSLQETRLQEAINNYYRALSTATDNDERSAACKNMAMANWKIAKAKTETGATSSSISFYFKEALKHFQDAKEHGKGRDYAWHDALVIASLGCWSDICDRLNEWEYREGVREREKLVTYIIDDATKSREYLDIANQYFNWAMTCLGERDYQQCLHQLAECNFPLNEARRFWREDACLNRECDLLEEDVHIQRCVGESIQARIRGEELLEMVVRDEEILNIDMVWEVVDWLCQAAQLTRDRDLEMEAVALSSLGKVYDKVLKLKDRAKKCLMKVLELADAMQPRIFTGDEWYEFARSTVERYQQEKIKAEEDQKQKKREETMKLIREELNVLREKQDSLTKLEFLKFVYKTHPPKKPEQRLGEVSPNAEWAELKKVYQRAVIHYHPDRVDEEEHGAKWKVLTEEITKLLTKTYEFYKGQ